MRTWGGILMAALVACGGSGGEGQPPPGDGPLPPQDGTNPPEALGNVYASSKSTNLYGMGWGRGDDLAAWSALPPMVGEHAGCAVGSSPDAVLIFGEAAQSDGYAYLVVEDRGGNPRGVIAEFVRETPEVKVTTGNAWQVCAVGAAQVALPASDEEDRLALDALIKACGAGEGRSGGWVAADGPITAGATGRLAVGEANDGDAGHFTAVCARDDHPQFGVGPTANWIWYAPSGTSDPFAAALPDSSLLIFRLPFEVLVIS
ncbi:MAG: hypothetical protein IPL79_03445 [Myxococcales bacterium]|nr:hypothetical protein [Myxococcales bacterium]